MTDTCRAMLVAGTSSGCGKTGITLGILAALAGRGLRIQPFKCGPDFIDPTLHRAVSGRLSRNLDIRMCGEAFVCTSFARATQDCDLSLVEGVMGLFDGGQGSAATLARLLGLPVVLVVDARSAAESVAAVVHGFASLDGRVRVAGVVVNRVASARHRELIGQALQKWCPGITVLGFVPRDPALEMPSRHLGLLMGDEQRLTADRLAACMERHLDLNRLIRLAEAASGSCPHVGGPEWTGSTNRLRLGIARDEAFCFYYQDNLDLLAAQGAELVPFSPLHDHELPAGLAGIYLGGGYPELYAGQLAGNRSMREAIYRFSLSGRPIYAECGGFMYLTEAILDREGREHPMAGVFPTRARMQSRLRSLGYRQPVLLNQGLLGAAGTMLYGHEFHYSAVDEMPRRVERVYRLADGSREGYLVGNTLGSYIHLHWGRTPAAAASLLAACRG